MNEENTKKLTSTFPSLYSSTFYFECHDGWFDLLWCLSRVLEERGTNLVATQVKEKYGTLRFYVETAEEKEYALIDLAMRLSGRICEICGDKGRSVGTAWVMTRCEKCHPLEEKEEKENG